MLGSESHVSLQNLVPAFFAKEVVNFLLAMIETELRKFGYNCSDI